MVWLGPSRRTSNSPPRPPLRSLDLLIVLNSWFPCVPSPPPSFPPLPHPRFYFSSVNVSPSPSFTTSAPPLPLKFRPGGGARGCRLVCVYCAPARGMIDAGMVDTTHGLTPFPPTRPQQPPPGSFYPHSLPPIGYSTTQKSYPPRGKLSLPGIQRVRGVLSHRSCLCVPPIH